MKIIINKTKILNENELFTITLFALNRRNAKRVQELKNTTWQYLSLSGKRLINAIITNNRKNKLAMEFNRLADARING